MSSLQSAFMIIMGELSIILAAILGYLAIRALRKHKSVMSAIGCLTKNIHSCKDELPLYSGRCRDPGHGLAGKRTPVL